MRRSIRLFAMVGGLLLLLSIMMTAAFAAPGRAVGNVYTVTTTADGNNPIPANSLRWAIKQANENPGADTVNFNISGSGVKTIFLVKELPEISSPVTLDATTQPGYSGSPLIQLDGAGAGIADTISGFTMNATGSGSILRGFIISGFPGNGVEIFDSSDNLVEANYIGTDKTGTDSYGNNKEGVLIGAVSGSASNNVIRNNVISGNNGSGVHVSSLGANNNKVQGNKIGTDKTGTQPLGNGVYGVQVEDATDNLIGGTGAGEGNIIAFNGTGSNKPGVILERRDGNTIRRNSIFSNGYLGIDVTPPGLSTALAPVIEPNGTPPTNSVKVKYQGDPNTTYTIEFFDNAACDPTAYGEGKTYLSSVQLTTNGSGYGEVNTTVSGSIVTATATGGEGTALNPVFTSEFSLCYTSTGVQTQTPTPTFTPIVTNTPKPSGTPIPTETLAPSRTPEPTDVLTPTVTPTRCSPGKPPKAVQVSPGNGATVFVRAVPLAWNESACAKFYKVLIKQGGPKGAKVQKKKVQGATQFTTKTLKKGEDYVWRVKACKSKKNCSKWSPYWKFKVSKNAAYLYPRDDWFVTAAPPVDTTLLQVPRAGEYSITP